MFILSSIIGIATYYNNILLLISIFLGFGFIRRIQLLNPLYSEWSGHYITNLRGWPSGSAIEC